MVWGGQYIQPGSPQSIRSRGIHPLRRGNSFPGLEDPGEAILGRRGWHRSHSLARQDLSVPKQVSHGGGEQFLWAGYPGHGQVWGFLPWKRGCSLLIQAPQGMDCPVDGILGKAGGSFTRQANQDLFCSDEDSHGRLGSSFLSFGPRTVLFKEGQP